jgi:hypothetical protein
VYADSGFTAVLFDVEREPIARYTHSIEQAVTVLDAVLNVVIDVKACAFKINDEGVQVADKIAAKAT